MDIAQATLQYNCPKHPDFQIEYLQVDNLSKNKNNQKLFYCSDCAFQDSNFKPQNYQLIKHIIKSGTDEILQNWPPVKDNQLLNQLIQVSRGQDEKESILGVIEKYYTDLKTDIMRQIDINQKKMIQQVLDSSQSKNQMLNIYQQISKVKELKSLLVNNQTDIYEKERQYRVLVESILLQKRAITQQLSQLLDQHEQQQIRLNAGSAIQVKRQILDSISSINFIEHSYLRNESRNANKMKLDVSLFTTDYGNGKKYTEINKNLNNQYELIVKQQSNYWFNTVSNIILENERKYIFRIEIKQKKENDAFFIGLMQDSNINSQFGCNDYLSCGLQYKNNFISQFTNYNCGINKLVKGNSFTLSMENQIEMRVCIQDQILEVYDYPNYYCKLALKDDYKNKLTNHKSFRFYLGIYHLKSGMILNEVFIVDQFQ